MKTRPTLASIGDRRAPILHRTLPTWARQSGDQEVIWRLYVPCAEGGAYFVHVEVPVSCTRSEAASRLRAARAGLWSKSRTTATQGSSPDPAAITAAPAPVDVPAATSSSAASVMNTTVGDAELEERTLPSGSPLMEPKPKSLTEAASDSSPTPSAPSVMDGNGSEHSQRQELPASEQRQPSLF